MNAGSKIFALMFVLLTGSFTQAACNSPDMPVLFSRADKLREQGQYLLSSQQYAVIAAVACTDEDRGLATFHYAQSLYRLDEKLAAQTSLQELYGWRISLQLNRKARLLEAWYEPAIRGKLSETDQKSFLQFEADKSRLQSEQQVKKPWLAGTMSALIPGLGQVYNENYSAAAFSLLLNSLFLATAIELHNKELNTSALAAGVIFSITYTGNILGSVESARQINRSYQEPLINNLRKEKIQDLEL